MVSERTKARLQRYPNDWKKISAAIRERAGNRCECEGECGLHRTHPGPRRCIEINGQPAKWAKGTVILTTAHLDHVPENCDPSNLKAMCQRCHLRYDMKLHQQHSYETRRKGKVYRDLFELLTALTCWGLG